MADEYSTRENLENDLKEIKDDAKTLARPIENKIKDKIKDEIGDRIGKHVAEMGAREAAKAAAQTAGTASAAGAAAAQEAATNAAANAAEASAGATAGGTAGTAGAAGASAGGSAAGAAAGGAVAEGASAGAAAGPPGIVVGAIIGAAIALASAVKKETDVSLDNDNPDGPKVNMIFLAVVICIFGLVSLGGTLISKGVSSPLSVGQETEFQNTVVNGKNMAPAGDQYKEGTELKEFDTSIPLKNAIKNYTYGTDGKGVNDGLRATLAKAIMSHCKTLVEKLDQYTGTINGHPYDNIRSLKSFYDNRFPYDLKEGDFEPQIGCVLQPDKELFGEYDPWLPRYDDVNYAEIFSIFGMSNSIDGATYGFDWGDINYADFMEFLQKEECYKYMYELGLKWTPVYTGEKIVTGDDGTDEVVTVEVEPYEYDSPDECKEAPESVVAEGVTCTWDDYYVKVTVKPFGLRELFAIAFGTDNPQAKADEMHINFDQHTNLYMLNYSERVTRIYQRKFKMNIVDPTTKAVLETVDALGPSYQDARDDKSPIYDDLIHDPWLIANNWQGTGRSAWYYIEKTYNDEFENIVWDGDPGGSNPPGEDFTAPGSAKILDMYEYINQGDYPSTIRGSSKETVKESGCLDCSVAMIAMYYKRYHIPITEVSKHVPSNGRLETGTALAEFGLYAGGDHYGNVVDGIINEINNDRPVIIHIRGYWYSGDDGRVLHGTSNGHFLVGIGYDETGLYVYDPGRRANYHISYADWSHVGDLYYRPVYQK